MATPCTYCGAGLALTPSLPLCATCAEKLRHDPAFAEQLTRHIIENAARSVRRMRRDVEQMRDTMERGTPPHVRVKS